MMQGPSSPRNGRERTTRGFSLVEVVVATAVMAMMLVSLITYVQMATEVWKRSDQTVTLSAEAGMVFDTIRTNLSMAIAITTPALGETRNQTRFVASVATGSPEINRFYIGNLTLQIQIVPGPPKSLVTKQFGASAFSGGKTVSFVSGAESANPYEINLDRFVGTLTEHLATFTATRLSSNSLQIYLLLESPEEGEIYSTTNATPAFCATGTFLAPEIR